MEKSRIIDGRIKHMWELCKFGLLIVRRVDTNENVADQFTKLLGPKKLKENIENFSKMSANTKEEEEREGGKYRMHDIDVRAET